VNAKRTVGCFVTGTDTGVGKTLASCGLLHALARHHARVVGMKAVAAGAEPDGQGGWANEDTLALRAASTLAVAPELDNPVLLPDPMSPHIAAQRAGRTIEIAHIVDSYRRLAEQADAVVVEGAGGFLVPLSDQLSGADLAWLRQHLHRQLQAPLLADIPFQQHPDARATAYTLPEEWQ
jgi:dethiobiotin synthetase